ncbi:MAG: hypothetical protein RRA32_02295 [bacterium]|nr:hypothetical protein [bacterium]
MGLRDGLLGSGTRHPPSPEATAGGTSTQGGDGDTSTIQSDGDVIPARTGTVDASFPDPVYTANLGANGYTVSADITVLMDEDLVDGGLYVKSTLMRSSVRIYEGNGDDDSGLNPAVTGIYVAVGATLTLPVASDTGGTPKAWYLLDNDLIVQGTVTTADDSTYLSFEIDDGNEANIVVETDGLITTVPEAAGADGGRVYLVTDGSIIIKGDVPMSGTAPGGNDGGPFCEEGIGQNDRPAHLQGEGGVADPRNGELIAIQREVGPVVEHHRGFPDLTLELFKRVF